MSANFTPDQKGYKSYKTFGTFKLFVLENFPFIAEDFDALTYYQMLCKVVGFLKDVITNNESLQYNQTELLDAFNELQNYVNTYFDSLDVQTEINNKLDQMAQDGTLANIINNQIFEDLNTKIQNNENNITKLENNIKTYPVYDMLKNGAYADGINANDTIFNNAKNTGYRKFYFPQNENKNANYYFTNTPNFNDCEIMTDDGVVLNFPAMNGINNTHNAKFKNNVLIYTRQQERIFNVPKNESDFFNQFSLPNYKMEHPEIFRLNSTKIKLFTFNYGTGLFVDNTSNKENYFQSIGYDIRYKAKAGYSLVCVPIDKTKKQCIEIVTTNNTHIAMGWLDSENLTGVYSIYGGSPNGKYYYVNGNANPQETDYLSTKSNLFSHNGQYGRNNSFGLPMKYKLRNDPDNEEIQVFVNDVFVHSIPWGVQIDYFGFGIYESSTPNLNSDKGFSEILKFNQTKIPLNSTLNILIAGDSRMYGYNSQYHIEDVIKNGLKNNGINVVNITNISVSGWNMSQIYDAIQNQDLTNYDVIIVPTGINDINSDYETILQTAFNIMNYCRNNKCFVIMPATIPVGYGGTDAMVNQRTDVYYKIQQAILSASGYISGSKRMTQVSPNIMGTTILSNNIEVCSDGVHPTTEGTILFAKSLVNTILHILD